MMVIVGGGSILLNHSFRNTSYDIDSLIYGNSAYKKYLLNKYHAQDSETNYDEFLKDELKEDYDTFIRIITEDDK